MYLSDKIFVNIKIDTNNIVININSAYTTVN